MDDNKYQRMLASLRGTFAAKLPNGLSEPVDARLKRTLSHYTREVTNVTGTMNEQEILRQSYDSMAAWLRRNTEYINTQTVSPSSTRFDGEVDDPLALFKSTPLSSLDGLPPALQAVETRPGAPLTTLPPELQPADTRSPPRSLQPKDFITKEEDIVKYRENEYNLVLNSKDRDWLNNTSKQNRYSFSVVLDSASRPQGTGTQLTIMNRFRNIVRLEFVKAILPVEALDVVVPQNCTDVSANYADTFYSVLGLPYVNVTLDEYQGNNYGTTDSIDRSLAICQYDATWRSDNFQTNDNTSRGFALYFPKFMRAQRVYAPTPLANFQRLTFQILNPENQPLSCTPDAYSVSRILFGADASGSCYSDASSSYLFIQTKEFFPAWAFSQLDKVAFAGLTFTSANSTIQAGGAALIDWLQREQGHVVVKTAYSVDATNNVYDGANSAGYANYIIIRNRFTAPDPITGAVAINYFTGNSTDEATLADQAAAYPSAYQEGGVLNLNRQVQLTLRVITRDFDAASNLRPDNV
jgi:hypothetical protein